MQAELNRWISIRSLSNPTPKKPFLQEVGFFKLGRLGLLSQSGTPLALEVDYSPFLHLVMVYGGSISMHSVGGSIALREREAALFPQGFLRSSGAHSLVSISLPPGAVERAAAAIAGRTDALRIQKGFELRSLKASPMAGVFQSLVASLDALLPLGEALVGKLVTDDVLLRAVAVLLDPTLVSREQANPLRHRERLGRADFDALIDFIRANLDQPLRLTDLEAQSQWSRWALQEAFRQRLNATPMEWIREQRLQRAMEHLQRTQEPLPLGELALSCGYQRLSHFSRDFKKRFGIPPSQVRRH